MRPASLANNTSADGERSATHERVGIDGPAERGPTRVTPRSSSISEHSDFRRTRQLALLCSLLGAACTLGVPLASCGGRNKHAHERPLESPAKTRTGIDAATEPAAENRAVEIPGTDAWRHQLAGADAMAASGTPTYAAWLGSAPPSDGEEAEAFVHAARWGRALTALAERDATLAERVRVCVAGVVSLPGGERVPAWDSPQHAAALLAAIETATESTTENPPGLEPIRNLLAERPRAVVWVIDDGGTAGSAVEGASGVATLGIANLTDQPALASATPQRRSAPGELSAVSPMSVRFIRVATEAAGDGDQSRDSRVLDVMVGSERFSRRIESGVDARPPGFTFGPLTPAWDRASWLGVASSADALMGATTGLSLNDRRGVSAWQAETLALTNDPRIPTEYLGAQRQPNLLGATAGRLYRDASAEYADRMDEGWVLYLECAAGSAPTHETGGEEVRLWFGPFGVPKAVLVVTPDGRVRDDLSAIAATDAQVTPLRDKEGSHGWAAWVPIPSSCVDTLADGSHVLRLGVVRHHVKQVDERPTPRTSWPRAMLPHPWQIEPGRATILLDAWTK